MNFVQWARALLRNGLGRYDAAYEAARDGAAVPLELGVPQWALAELVEAAARSGETRAAARALEELTAMAGASGTDWALGVAAGRRALLADGTAADDLYCEAIERLARTRMRLELAGRSSCYGEWLRREGRRVDARATLRTAYRAFTIMGAQAFADRARRELLATGETVRKRTPDTTADLTAQEAHIARLAARASRMPRSASPSTSAPAPWSGTCARSSASSASVRAGSSGSPCGSRHRRHHRHRPSTPPRAWCSRRMATRTPSAGAP